MLCAVLLCEPRRSEAFHSSKVAGNEHGGDVEAPSVPLVAVRRELNVCGNGMKRYHCNRNTMVGGTDHHRYHEYRHTMVWLMLNTMVFW